MSLPRIAVIGAGVMGTLHARSIATSDRATLGQVIDLDHSRARAVAGEHGGIPASPSAAINADAVIIATPTEHHVDLACELLSRGTPVLVEKPLAPTGEGFDKILSAARNSGAVLMCGFVERFNPAVVAMQEIIDEPMLHFMSVRHSPPTPRIGSSVASDLLIHDVDLALRVHAATATAHRLDDKAMGLPPISGGLRGGPVGASTCEIADCSLSFADGALATLSACRIGHRKIRELRITTGEAQYELDLLRHDLTIYRHLEHGEGRGDASYRSETVIEIPFVRARQEPLASQLDHFCDLIAGVADPIEERAGIWAPHQLMYTLTAPNPAKIDLAVVQG